MGYFCALQNYMACLFYGFYNTASSGIFNIFLMTFLPDEKYSLYNHRQSHLIFYIFLNVSTTCGSVKHVQYTKYQNKKPAEN